MHITPIVDVRLGSVGGSYHSRAGEIKVSWQIEGKQILLHITTPVEAEIQLPDGEAQTVSAGNYQYICNC